MGLFGDSVEEVNEKQIDSTGHVNTNIIIQEARDTHGQLLVSKQLLHATYILVGAEILKLCIYAFQSLRKMFKKKYQPNQV